jgi:hypothetical protein
VEINGNKETELTALYERKPGDPVMNEIKSTAQDFKGETLQRTLNGSGKVVVTTPDSVTTYTGTFVNGVPQAGTEERVEFADHRAPVTYIVK